jgi:hypothetical protein
VFCWTIGGVSEGGGRTLLTTTICPSFTVIELLVEVVWPEFLRIWTLPSGVTETLPL